MQPDVLNLYRALRLKPFRRLDAKGRPLMAAAHHALRDAKDIVRRREADLAHHRAAVAATCAVIAEMEGRA
jgi:hypothetical protein